MLSSESAAVIRATLPAVGAAIGDITVLFYSNMFAAYPELERDLFNRSRQRHGVQQKALAGAIATFAALQIDPATDDDKVRTMLSRIAHKHASLGITAEQYQIVHKYLFEAIVEVLGAAVTPAVAKAWDEVYWLMAGTLTALEIDLYHSAGLEPGDVWRTVAVRQRVIQSADTVTFVLCSLDGSVLPRFSPGQYLSVGVHLPDGARQIRQYSLIDAPSHDDEWRITVKHGSGSIAPDSTELDTIEISNFLYNNVFEGDTLEVSALFATKR
jgi:nitric oxide dioxygenase